MDLGIAGRVCVVTGGSRGIGLETARRLRAEGAKVLLVARDAGVLADAAEGLDGGDEEIATLPLDITEPDAGEQMLGAALEAFDGIDVLVNNAGYANTDSIEDLPLDDFRAQIDTNFYGVVHLTRAVLPVMRQQRSGRILQISSVGGRRGGTPGLSAYQAAKFAVAGFSEVLINEVAPLGIQVSIIEPGGFATDWAGSSMKIYTPKPDYQMTVGATNDRLRGNPSAARGVPAKAAQVLLQLANMDKQPRRLLLGSDAFVLARATLQELVANDDANRTLSVSTDADGLPDFAETDVGKAMLKRR
jgi:NAD(P)-dependent dehydrogenase (short-subunit alcohol dehydrogenase family)